MNQFEINKNMKQKKRKKKGILQPQNRDTINDD